MTMERSETDEECSVKVEICEVTPALCSTLVAEVYPQCDQSLVPSVVRLTWPLVAALEPVSVPVAGRENP